MRPHRRSESGIALVAVLLIVALLMGLGAALSTTITMDSGLIKGFNNATAGFYAAEAGLNTGMNGFRNMFLARRLPCSGTSTSCAHFDTQTYDLGGRAVNYRLQDPGLGNPKIVSVPAGQLFAGLNSIQYNYLVNSKSVYRGLTEASVGSQFAVNNIPLFQFLAFYAGDLEILPGANMVMHGRVHTNGKLYLNSDATLQITTDANNPIVQVTAKDDIYRGRKNNTSCGGTVQLMTSGASPTLKTLACGSGSQIVQPSTLATWNGSMRSRVSNIAIPEPGITNRDGEYWTNADLRIALILNTGPFPSGAPPAGPYAIPLLESSGIAVLNANGSINDTLTAHLKTFMNDASFNANRSAFRGTKPVFVSDVPLSGTPRPGCSCDASAWPPTGCAPASLNCYWGTPMATLTPTPTSTPAPNRTTTRTPTATPTPTFTQPAQSPTPTPSFAADKSFSNPDRVYTTNTTATLGDPNAIGSMFKDSDPRRGGFYNWREKKWMYLLNINLRDLLQWNMDNGYPFFDPNNVDGAGFDPTRTAKGGPVIYFTVIGPDSNTINNYGVRIFGSSPLPFPTPKAGDPAGVTVVSDQALYLAGDYNVGGTVSVGGTNVNYPKQPAALMADSINVMSNNALVATSGGNSCTNDCQSTLPLGSRPAVNTQAFAAFLAGVDETIGGTYNGGLENYPRFHEDWGGGRTFTYRGSFVSLGTPLHVNGQWCGTGGSSTSTSVSGCNIYNPPNRQFDFDHDFNDVKKLPPMTPTFVYLQQIVFTEHFD